jgi:hypothetical protein
MHVEAQCLLAGVQPCPPAVFPEFVSMSLQQILPKPELKMLRQQFLRHDFDNSRGTKIAADPLGQRLGLCQPRGTDGWEIHPTRV